MVYPSTPQTKKKEYKTLKELDRFLNELRILLYDKFYKKEIDEIPKSLDKDKNCCNNIFYNSILQDIFIYITFLNQFFLIFSLCNYTQSQLIHQ